MAVFGRWIHAALASAGVLACLVTLPATAGTTIARIEGTVTGTDGRRLEAFMPLPPDEELHLADGSLLMLFHDGHQVSLPGPVQGVLSDLLPAEDGSVAPSGPEDDLLRAALRALSDWMFTDDSTTAVAGIRGSDAGIQPLIEPSSGWLAPDILDGPLLMRADADALGTSALRLVAVGASGEDRSWTVRIAGGAARVPDAALAASAIELRVARGDREVTLATWRRLSEADQRHLALALGNVDRELGSAVGIERLLLRAAILAEAGCRAQAAAALDEALEQGAGRPEAERATIQPWSPIALHVGAQWRPTPGSADWQTLEAGEPIPSGATLSFVPHASLDAHVALLIRSPDGSWERLISGWLTRYGLAVDPADSADRSTSSPQLLTSIALDLDANTGRESLVMLVSIEDRGWSQKNRFEAVDLESLGLGLETWQRPDGRYQAQGYGVALVRVDFDHVNRP